MPHIRPATENDTPEIARIYAHYVQASTATFELEPPTAEEMSARHFTVVALGLPFLVAEEDRAILGYAYATQYRPRPGYQYTIEDSVYVDPRHLGRGVGRALLSALIEQCERGPWRQMIAVIGDTANTASLRLHERFGFRGVGTLDSVGFKFDRWVDSVLMQRALGAGDGSEAGNRDGPSAER